MIGLTKRQRQCLEFLRLRSRGEIGPNYDEIAAALNLKSKSGVTRLIHGLRDRGYIEMIPGNARSIGIISEQSRYVVEIPSQDHRRLMDIAARRKKSPTAVICELIDRLSMEDPV